MILVIAEKPSLGRDIADALPGQVTERNNRFIRKGDYAVTWVFGHMLSLKEPEDYDMKYKKWSLDDLPIYFDSWNSKWVKTVIQTEITKPKHSVSDL